VDRGELSAADSVVQDAIQLRRTAFGEDAPLTRRAEALRSVVLTGRGEFASADSILPRSLRLLRERLGATNPDVREI